MVSSFPISIPFLSLMEKLSTPCCRILKKRKTNKIQSGILSTLCKNRNDIIIFLHQNSTTLYQFLRKDWEEVKTDVMRDGLRLKFQDPTLRAKLLATGDEELIEGNTWHDNTWGACCCPECAKKKKENRLGKLLMQVRSEI